MSVIKEKHPGEDSRERMALAAALVHDVGHGPFSHAFEVVGERLGLKLADHEHVSDEIIKNGELSDILNTMGRGFAEDVADIIKKQGRVTVHNAVVSSQFDADRLDYIRRDRLMTGTHHSAIDYEWLIANLELADVPIGVDDTPVGAVTTFVIGQKAVFAAEAFVLGLFQLYPTVYFHKTTRGAEKIFQELLVRVIALVHDGTARKTGLPSNHPLVQFARQPEKIDVALKLDDAVVWGALSMMCDANDSVVSGFSKMLRDRVLYKCTDVRAIISHAIDPRATNKKEVVDRIDYCSSEVEKKLLDLMERVNNPIPKILVDKATRSPYKTGDAADRPTGTINVRTDGGELLDLKERSAVVSSLTDFKSFRVYVERNEPEVVRQVKNIVEGEIAACP